MGLYDDIDVYGTFSPEEAAKLGIVHSEQMAIVDSCGDESSAIQVTEIFEKK